MYTDGTGNGSWHGAAPQARTAGRQGTYRIDSPTANGGAGAREDELPAELARKLRALGRAIPPTEISELWVFPPLELEGSGDFLLFTRFHPDERRRLCTAALSEDDEAVPRIVNASTNGHADGNGKGNGTGTGNGAGAHPLPVDDASPLGPVREHGAVPPERLHRLVQGFRERLGEERDPIHLRVDGCPRSWDRMVSGVPAPD